MWQDNRTLEEDPLWLIIWESKAPQHGKTNPSSSVIRAVSLTLALGLPCLGGFMGWGKLDLSIKGQGIDSNLAAADMLPSQQALSSLSPLLRKTFVILWGLESNTCI